MRINKNLLIILAVMVLLSCENKTRENGVDSNKINADIKKEYYNSGELKVRAELKNGVEHGGYYKFYKDQTLLESGIKIKGKKNGLWKHYDSLGKVKTAVHYYNDSIVYNLEVNDFDYTTKKLDSNLSMEIPRNWKIVSEIIRDPILLVLRKECEKEISFCPNLTVTYENPITTNQEIDSYLKKNDNILNSKFENYRVIKERKYAFEDRIYFEKVYTGSSQDMNLGGITTWIFHEDKTYIITGLALNEKENSFLKYEGLFKDIMHKAFITDKN